MILGWSNYQSDLWWLLHKKNHVWHSENGKWVFCPKKMKTPYGNIVWHSKSHTFAQYKIISTNYAMFMLKTLVMWLESPETSFMIALFCEHFLKMFVIFKVWYFLWQIGHIKWHNTKVFHFFLILFEFLMPVWKCIQNGGHDLQWLGMESCKTLCGSLIKYQLVYLNMIFLKIYEQTMW
jgi:hypothetical protein